MLKLAAIFALICAFAVAVDTHCDTDGDCLAGCEVCVDNACVSTCETGSMCVQIEFGVGECRPICDPELCQVFDPDTHSCVSTCVGCTSCDAGECVSDESLRNECGKCPGEGDCCVLDDNIAFTGCLVVGENGTDINERINDLECRIIALEQAAAVCIEDADCADCNTCTIDTCSSGMCVHTPVAEPDAELVCGPCDAFPVGPYGPCDDGNPCTTDSCLDGNCHHVLQLYCVQ